MAGDACVQEAGWKDLPFLGDRTIGKSRRYRLAILEPHGLHAGGTARPAHAAAKLQIRIFGAELRQGVAWWRSLLNLARFEPSMDGASKGTRGTSAGRRRWYSSFPRRAEES